MNPMATNGTTDTTISPFIETERCHLIHPLGNRGFERITSFRRVGIDWEGRKRWDTRKRWERRK